MHKNVVEYELLIGGVEGGHDCRAILDTLGGADLSYNAGKGLLYCYILLVVNEQICNPSSFISTNKRECISWL